MRPGLVPVGHEALGRGDTDAFAFAFAVVRDTAGAPRRGRLTRLRALCDHRASPIASACDAHKQLKGVVMSQGTNDMYRRAMPGAGWIGFAGILLILVGFFNVIGGIAAIGSSDYLVNELLFANMDAWGWFFLIWGVIQIFAGFAVLGGAAWAAIVGIVTAFFNVIAQLSWAHTNPVWAVCAMVIDVLIIYGLIVYGGRGSEA
jgi:hypothetical protein